MHLSEKDCSSTTFTSSNDDILVKKIVETHFPDGRQINAEPLIHVIEMILKLATTSTTISQVHLEAMVDDFTHNIEIVHKEPLGCIIYRISCEIRWKCFEARGSHANATMTLLNSLGNFAWDAKMVLVLAAFVMNYGELWLIAQLCNSDPLAMSLAIFKKFPHKSEHSGVFMPIINALNSLVKAMLEVTKCIIEFEDLPWKYITPENVTMAETKMNIPIAAYWTIRSVVACSSLIVDLISTEYEQATSTSISWSLWSLVCKVSNIHVYMRKQLDACHQHIEVEAYKMLLRHFEETYTDNQKIFSTLFPSKDGLPLRNGSSIGKFGVDVLRSKIVILFVSSLDITREELLLLVEKACNCSHNNINEKLDKNYEIVWVPISKRISSWRDDTAGEEAFNQLAGTLDCYYVCQPWLFNPGMVKYVREMWKLDKREKSMLVFDPQGRVTCKNAIDMIMIWGASRAYPFSTSGEEELWKEANWTIEFVIDDIDPMISLWIKKGRTICLYGSEDLDWIREFTSKIKHIMSSGITLEVVYVGMSNLTDGVRETLATIMEENISSYLTPTQMYLFWIRLESMQKSKMRNRNKNSTETDLTMEEVMATLKITGGDKGWALMGSEESKDIVKLSGRKLIECLSLFEIRGNKFEAKGKNIESEEFLRALRNAVDPPIPEHSNQYSVPYVDGLSQEIVVCEECKRPMEKYNLYQCSSK